MATKPIGYSYIRFSTPEQARGDSLRRQSEAAAAWCERNSVALDTSRTLHDLGKSAYLGEHRKNDDRYALAAFLKMVERGQITRGSFLIVENLDRLTREHVRAAVALFLSILEQGISIVTTTPERVFRHDSQDMTDIIIAVVEMSRGHGESERKSERVGAAWAEKRRRVRAGEKQLPTKRMGEGCQVLTNRLPAWVKVAGGKPVLIPERAAVVRRIFQLAANGYGIPTIIAKFTRENVPPIGRTGKWTRSYVNIILRDRRALGELQLRHGAAKEGEVIRGYYPAAVSENEWLAARAGAAERGTHRGRTGKQDINIFAGLLWNARDGDSYQMTQRLSRSGGKLLRRYPVLINRGADEGCGRAYSIAYRPFEAAVLSCLKEIDPSEILNGDAPPDESLVLAGELASVEAELSATAADMERNGFSALIGQRVRQLEARKRDLAERLAAARQKAIHPLSESWGEAQSLANSLSSAPDQNDARLRLRSALRRIAEGVWLLIAPRGQDRLAAVRIQFTNGGHRDYLLLNRPAKGRHTPARTEVASFAEAVPQADGLDLRTREDAEALAEALEAVDLKAIMTAPPGPAQETKRPSDRARRHNSHKRTN